MGLALSCSLTYLPTAKYRAARYPALYYENLNVRRRSIERTYGNWKGQPERHVSLWKWPQVQTVLRAKAGTDVTRQSDRGDWGDRGHCRSRRVRVYRRPRIWIATSLGSGPWALPQRPVRDSCLWTPISFAQAQYAVRPTRLQRSSRIPDLSGDHELRVEGLARVGPIGG